MSTVGYSQALEQKQKVARHARGETETETETGQETEENFTYVYVYAALRGQSSRDVLSCLTYAASGECDNERCSNRLRSSHNLIDKIVAIYWLGALESSPVAASGHRYCISGISKSQDGRGGLSQGDYMRVSRRVPGNGVAVQHGRSDYVVRRVRLH